MNNELLLEILRELTSNGKLEEKKPEEKQEEKQEEKPEPQPEEKKKPAEKKPAEKKQEEKPEEKQPEEPKNDDGEDKLKAIYQQLVESRINSELANAGIDSDQATALLKFVDFNLFRNEAGELAPDTVKSFTDTVSGVALRKPPVSPTAKRDKFGSKNAGIGKYLEEN